MEYLARDSSNICMNLLNLFKRTSEDAAHSSAGIPLDAESQYRLGSRYATGQGVPQNYVVAYKWLSFAAAQGHDEAETMRLSLADRMKPQQIAEAERLVATHAPRKAAAA